MTRVLIADDHEVVRSGIRAILEARRSIEVIGEASTGEEVVRQALELEPDLIVMDIGLPLVNGLTAGEMIKKIRPETSIVVFSMYDSTGMENTARELGFNGFVAKSEGATALLNAIDAVNQKRDYFHRDQI